MSGTGRHGASVATSVRVTREKPVTGSPSACGGLIKSRLFSTTFLFGAAASLWLGKAIAWWGRRTFVLTVIAFQGAGNASVSGTGTSGTASVDVKFGKAGTYTATPHGLVPAEGCDVGVLAVEIDRVGRVGLEPFGDPRRHGAA